jgi:Leucine-rich repeat (LRR) protein
MPYNHFTKIPDVLLQLKQLKELNLSHNQIRGKVVLEGNTIEQLDLSHNEIEDFESLHDDVSNLTKLNLSHNQISTLPSSFEGWIKLQELLLNQNKLRVLFPGEFIIDEALDKKVSSYFM